MTAAAWAVPLALGLLLVPPVTPQASATSVSATSVSTREVVFYSPHADDETLTLGVVIAQHVLAGRTVHVVLLSDGNDSAALPTINARLVQEHRAPLTRAQFGAARISDFRAACARLGVPAANVHVEAVAGSAFSVTYAKSVIAKYEARYPAAGHYTMSWTDTFAPHHNAGEALRELAAASPSTYPDTRWGVYRPHWSEAAVRAVHPWFTVPGTTAKQRVLSAVALYGLWDPAHGRYRIGFYSVGAQFTALRNDVRSMLHAPAV